MDEILRLQRITKEFNGKQALREVSLEVKRGEIFFIVGPNGAGKTTLLRIMAFLEKPTSGEIFFEGKAVRESARLRKKITMVFQTPVFFNSTVFDNVAYGLKLRGYSSTAIKRMVEETLASVNLREEVHGRVRELSGGEKQRVALARALALRPEILLLDEPTADLDPANVRIVEDLIRKLRGKSTLVVTTHHLAQARRLSDRVACIYGGNLLEVGSPRHVFTRPRDWRTEKFIHGELF
jgi:tungstate transport system ATP-binding protein